MLGDKLDIQRHSYQKPGYGDDPGPSSSISTQPAEYVQATVPQTAAPAEAVSTAATFETLQLDDSTLADSSGQEAGCPIQEVEMETERTHGNADTNVQFGYPGTEGSEELEVQ